MKPKRLGDAPAGKSRNKYGWYECPACKKPYRTRDTHVRSGASTKCKACRDKNLGEQQFKHGASNTTLYHTWRRIKSDWVNFEDFKAWAIANSYKEGLHPRKICAAQPYGPDNLVWTKRWADAAAQGKIQKNNTSGYIGVIFSAASSLNPWIAGLVHKKCRIHIGVYPTPEAAARARNRYIKEHDLPHRLNKIK